MSCFLIFLYLFYFLECTHATLKLSSFSTLNFLDIFYPSENKPLFLSTVLSIIVTDNIFIYVVLVFRFLNSSISASLLGSDCEDDLQCQYYDQNAICQRLSRDYVSCTCIENYVMRDIEGLQPPKVCFPGQSFNQVFLYHLFLFL